MRRYATGLVLIVVVAVIWSVASLVVADAESDGVDPFFITFVCNSLFVLLLPLGAAKEETKSARYLSPLWMVANGSYNVALSLTSITSSTILSTTSSLWALFFAVRWRVEPRGKTIKTRALGAVLCVAGSALAAFSDTSTKNESFVGDVVALLSAALYGAYGAGLRLGDDSERAPFKFFGMLGLWNFAYFAVPLAVYLAVRQQKGDSSSSLAKLTGFARRREAGGRTFGLIVAKGLFDNVLSDFLWAQAVIRTTPTVATVGLSLTIPLAFLTDAFVTKKLPTSSKSLALQLSGAVLVVAGFLCTVLASTPSEQNDPESAAVVAAKQQQRHDDDDQEEEEETLSSDISSNDDPVSVVHASTNHQMLVVVHKQQQKQQRRPDFDDDASSSTRSPLLPPGTASDDDRRVEAAS
mmetsp:Transcript_7986/g.24664  ORF Transcript_7986/g.24664 Transcript_7986/m.24664 type:complete len:410 (+) Transcript_7986:242-1471(+)